MKSLHKSLIVLLFLAAAVAGYSLARLMHPSQSPPVLPTAEPVSPAGLLGSARPEFSLPDLTGRPRQLAEWNGQVLLLNFWATWCAPCREEIPAFLEVRRRYRHRGFEILGVAIDSPEFVIEYVREFGIDYPMLYGSEEAIETGRLYGNERGTLPYSVFIDREGRIAHIHNSGLLTESGLIRIVEGILDAPAENEPKRSKLSENVAEVRGK